MFGENKNLKDSITPSPLQGEGKGKVDSQMGLSYTKTNKLITALYMVTDIMDNDEPIRNRLRTLGLEILSDTSTMSKTPLDIVVGKIDQIMSFLDITSTINIISEMNYSILKKEFLELNQSLKEFTDKVKTINKQINLSEFFREFPSARQGLAEGNKGEYSIGHQHSTRVGVQKGSTLMKALSDKIGTEARPQGLRSSYARDFDILKKQRRNDIINIIKSINGNATIKDIKDRVRASQGENDSLASCGEKTLQRELVSMVKDSVLNKTGKKRWSRYFLVSRS